MTNRRSPGFTSCPSLKPILSMYPLTRGRTSTLSTASVRPVYSSHSTISFWIGFAAVTGGGGAGACVGAGSLHATIKAQRTSATRRVCHGCSILEGRFINEGQLLFLQH